MYLGDVRLGTTQAFQFTTRSFATGVPTTLAGSPVISAYVDSGTTEITAGITLSVDFDGRTGLNNVSVVLTSGNGYATATNINFVITTGTVGGVSVVGEVIGQISIENRSALMPTTGGRTLDVTATGAGGVDWGNLENPTTANGLTGTTIATSQVVASVTGAVGSVTGAVGSVTAIVTANMTQIDGNATNGNNATLNLKKLNIVNNAGDAIVASATGGNGIGIHATGNGSGDGIFGGGGTTGHGIEGVGGSSQGDGIRGISTLGATSGAGIRAHAFADDGDGIEAKAANGSGIVAQALGGNFAGFGCTGSGTNPGIAATGGATGNGATFTAGGGNGEGLLATGAGSGSGLRGSGGTSGHGLYGSGGPSDGDGIRGSGQGDGRGLAGLGAGDGAGIYAEGGDTGIGMEAAGGGTSGDGFQSYARVGGDGFACYGASGNGFGAFGDGANPGMNVIGGATGAGAQFAGQGGEKSIVAAVETGADLIESLRLANAANAGKLSGAATTNVKIRDLADSLDRIDATVDASGNRTAVTRNVT